MNIFRELVGDVSAKELEREKLAISLFSYKRINETGLCCISTKLCSWLTLKWNHNTRENYYRPKCTSVKPVMEIVDKLKFVSSICSLFSGDPNSFVMGHIFKGKFDGSFFAFGESFYLEPAARYFHFKTPFHSIIFPASSVQDNSSGIQRKMARVKDLQSVVTQVLTLLWSYLKLWSHFQMTDSESQSCNWLITRKKT